MGKGGGGQKSTGTQTVINEPAEFVKPYYTQIAREAANIYKTGNQQYFPGSTVVPFSGDTEQALQMQRDRALAGSPLVNAAQDQQAATIRGDYLTGSPALEQELKRIGGKVNSQFATGGGYRSSANQEVLAREMADAAVRNYAGERTLQQQAALASPQFAAQDYANIEALRGVGGAMEELAGRNLQDEMNRFYFEQDKKGAALDDYLRRVTGVGAGSGTQTSRGTQPSVGGSPLQGALGGLSTGLGIAGALGGLGSTSAALGAGTSMAALGGPVGLGIAGLATLGGLFR